MKGWEYSCAVLGHVTDARCARKRIETFYGNFSAYCARKGRGHKNSLWEFPQLWDILKPCRPVLLKLFFYNIIQLLFGYITH